VSTVFNIMFDVLQRDEKASFFFIGAEDEKDVQGRATRRFQFYSDFTLSVVSSNVFQHFRNDRSKGYVRIEIIAFSPQSFLITYCHF